MKLLFCSTIIRSNDSDCAIVNRKKMGTTKKIFKAQKKILKKKIKTHFMHDIFDFALLKLKK